MTDLSTLATKQDLAKVETRLEAKIEKLDAKIDSVHSELKQVESRLDNKINNLAISLVKTQAEIREMRAEMPTKTDINRDMNRIFNYLDSMSGTVSNYQKQDMARKEAIAQHNDAIQDHEKRLTLLEN